MAIAIIALTLISTLNLSAQMVVEVRLSEKEASLRESRSNELLALYQLSEVKKRDFLFNSYNIEYLIRFVEGSMVLAYDCSAECNDCKYCRKGLEELEGFEYLEIKKLLSVYLKI